MGKNPYSIQHIRLAAAAAVLLLFITAGMQYRFAHTRMYVHQSEIESITSPRIMMTYGPHGESFAILEQWRVQYYGLVTGCAVLFLIAFIAAQGILKHAAVAFQILLFCVSLYADVFYLSSQFTLYLALAFGFHLLFPLLSASALTLASLAALAGFPRVPTAWYFIPPDFPADAVITMEIGGLAAAVLIHAVRVMHQRLQQEQRMTAHLRSSVIQLTSANVNFQDYAASAEERSSREERNRITREVHDTIGHTLTNLVMMLESAKDMVRSRPEKITSHLSLAREQAQYALAEIRKTLRLLRLEGSEDQNSFLMLQNIFKTFETATNVKVHLEYRNISYSPKHMIDSTVLRIIQESLTNAFRHGNATEVRVLFWWDKGLSIVISDNGAGAESIEEGIGMRGMREQLEQIHGTVRTQSIKGKGFEVQVWIPERSEHEGPHPRVVG